MDISALSSSLSQLSIRHAVAIQTQKFAMDGAKNEGERVIKMLDNLVRITDSRVGTGVNVLA